MSDNSIDIKPFAKTKGIIIDIASESDFPNIAWRALKDFHGHAKKPRVIEWPSGRSGPVPWAQIVFDLTPALSRHALVSVNSSTDDDLKGFTLTFSLVTQQGLLQHVIHNSFENVEKWPGPFENMIKLVANSALKALQTDVEAYSDMGEQR